MHSIGTLLHLVNGEQTKVLKSTRGMCTKCITLSRLIQGQGVVEVGLPSLWFWYQWWQVRRQSPPWQTHLSLLTKHINEFLAKENTIKYMGKHGRVVHSRCMLGARKSAQCRYMNSVSLHTRLSPTSLTNGLTFLDARNPSMLVSWPNSSRGKKGNVSRLAIMVHPVRSPNLVLPPLA